MGKRSSVTPFGSIATLLIYTTEGRSHTDGPIKAGGSVEAPQRLFPPPHKQEVNSQHAVVRGGGRQGSGTNLKGVDAKKFRNRWLEKQSRNFPWEARRPPWGEGGVGA